MIVTSQQSIQVQHVTIESAKGFDEVKAALESIVPHLDETRKNGAEAELSILLTRDHGSPVRTDGQHRKALQYVFGNVLTAKMTRYKLAAGQYALLHVILYEDDAGRVRFEYDRPSSLFGQFGDHRVTGVARDLDAALECALLEAAG